MIAQLSLRGDVIAQCCCRLVAEGSTFAFSGNSSIMTFSYSADERQDRTRDEIAFGVVTSQSDAMLLRVESQDSDDHIEIMVVSVEAPHQTSALHKIICRLLQVGGNVFASYNLGDRDYPIRQRFEEVNDSRYHVIKFVREGPNATLFVDTSEQPLHPLSESSKKQPTRSVYQNLTKYSYIVK